MKEQTERWLGFRLDRIEETLFERVLSERKILFINKNNIL
jgi:hypothetical protein